MGVLNKSKNKKQRLEIAFFIKKLNIIKYIVISIINYERSTINKSKYIRNKFLMNWEKH